MSAFKSTRSDTYELDGPFIKPLMTDSDPKDPFVLTNTTVQPREDGSFNFERVEGKGSPHLKHWQITLGEYIGRKFLGLNIWTQWQATLPEGYVLFSECTSKPEDPLDVRSDQYVKCGPRSPKFRSPNEFIPHYCWILEGGPERPGFKCKCRYCRPGQRLKQTDINKELGLPESRGRAKGAPSKHVVVRLQGNGLYTVTVPA